MNPPENLLANLPRNLPTEVFETLVGTGAVKIERIISKGQATADGQWYDQDHHEWVMVVKGQGRILFADGSRMTMGPGDYVNIPAHVRHRVEWTDPNQETVWLAVHYSDTPIVSPLDHP
jgi:cupin 2 domain-containing protein